MSSLDYSMLNAEVAEDRREEEKGMNIVDSINVMFFGEIESFHSRWSFLHAQLSH
ncbi:MAG: hypothetical protein ACI9HK_001170 [Pirellulaceae bacterium]|jgi:hypothetical protein